MLAVLFLPGFVTLDDKVFLTVICRVPDVQEEVLVEVPVADLAAAFHCHLQVNPGAPSGRPCPRRRPHLAREVVVLPAAEEAGSDHGRVLPVPVELFFATVGKRSSGCRLSLSRRSRGSTRGS